MLYSVIFTTDDHKEYENRTKTAALLQRINEYNLEEE